MLADLIIYGGDVISMVDATPAGNKSKIEEAVAISEGKILEVGSKDKVFKHKGPETEIIFLDDQTLMPGMIEPHQHAVMCVHMAQSLVTNISGYNYR